MQNVHVLDPDRDVVAVPRVLTPDECAGRIARAERAGFDLAPITTARGFVVAPEIRNNTRAMFDDPREAAWLWERVRPFAPATWRTRWEVVGLNERLRVYRYEVGQQFAWHRDGAYSRANGETSKLTLMIYLDAGCQGGATQFAGRTPHSASGSSRCPSRNSRTQDRSAAGLEVAPETGKLLLFPHPLLHQGAPVTDGVKHVLRTDVMYRWAG